MAYDGLRTEEDLASQGYTPAQRHAISYDGNNLFGAATAAGDASLDALKFAGNAGVGLVNKGLNGTLGLFGIQRDTGENHLNYATQNAADWQQNAARYGRNLQLGLANLVGGTMQPAGVVPVPAAPRPVATAGAGATPKAPAPKAPTPQATQAAQAPRVPDKNSVMNVALPGQARTSNVTLPVPTHTGSVSNGITFGLPPVDMRASPGIASTPFVGLGYNPNNVVDPNQKTEEELLSSRIGQILSDRDSAVRVLRNAGSVGAPTRPGEVTRAKLIMDNATGLAQSLYGVMNTGQQVASKAITDVATSNADNQTKIADRQLANAAMLRHAQIAGQYGLLGEEAKANTALSAKLAEMQSKVMSESGANAKNLAEAGIINSRHQYALNAMAKDPQLAAWLLLNNMPETKVTVDANGGVYKTGPGTVVRVPTTEEINNAKAGK